MRNSFQEMRRKLGKRAFMRFSVHGASVSWMTVEDKCFPDETSPLSDIATSGLSFLTNNPPTEGSEVFLLLILPRNAENLRIQGKVIYSIHRGPDLTYSYRVGIKFKEFSESKGFNSLQSLSSIRKLEETYVRPKNL
jgi:hypothetical protein